MLRPFIMLTAMAIGVSLAFSVDVVKAAESMSSATRDFVSRAAMGNIYSVEASRIVLERSKDAEVRDFAQMMVDEHIKLNRGMKQVLEGQQVSEQDVPNALDQNYQRMLDDLKSASGVELETKYVTGQLQAHADMQRLFSTYTDTGDNKPLTDFTRQSLPGLQAHESDLRLFEQKSR